jgi:hypothetical protein
MLFAFIVVVCLVAALGGAQGWKIKLSGLEAFFDFPELGLAEASEAIPAASHSSMRRLGDGTAANSWMMTTAYSDSGCTKVMASAV